MPIRSRFYVTVMWSSRAVMPSWSPKRVFITIYIQTKWYWINEEPRHEINKFSCRGSFYFQGNIIVGRSWIYCYRFDQQGLKYHLINYFLGELQVLWYAKLIFWAYWLYFGLLSVRLDDIKLRGESDDPLSRRGDEIWWKHDLRAYRSWDRCWGIFCAGRPQW